MGARVREFCEMPPHVCDAGATVKWCRSRARVHFSDRIQVLSLSRSPVRSSRTCWNSSKTKQSITIHKGKHILILTCEVSIILIPSSASSSSWASQWASLCASMCSFVGLLSVMSSALCVKRKKREREMPQFELLISSLLSLSPSFPFTRPDRAYYI